MVRYDVCEIRLNNKTFYVVTYKIETEKELYMDDYIVFNFEKFSVMIGRFFLGEDKFQELLKHEIEHKLVSEESNEKLFKFIEEIKADFYDYLSRSNNNTEVQQ